MTTLKSFMALLSLIALIEPVKSQNNLVELIHDTDWDYAASIHEFNDNFLIGVSTRSQRETDYDMLFFDFDKEINLVYNDTYIGEEGKLEFIKSMIFPSSEEIIVSYSSRVTNPFNFKAALLKLDSEKEKVWSLEFPNEEIRVDARRVLEKSNGEFIVLGSSTFSEPNTSFIYTVSSNGELVETEKFDEIQAIDFVQTSEEQLILGGRTKREDEYDAHILKINESGEKIWENIIDYGMVESVRVILPENDIEYLVLIDIHAGIYDFQFEKPKLLKYSDDELQFAIELPDQGEAVDIKKDIDGNYLILIEVRGTDNDGLELLTYNSNFELVCKQHIPNHYADISGDLLLTSSDMNYFIGHVQNLVSKADVNLVMMPKECNEIIIEDDFLDCETELKIFPNPVSESFKLINENIIEINEIIIFDLWGRKVMHKNGLTLAEKVPVEKLNAGTYFVEIISQCGKTIKKLIITK